MQAFPYASMATPEPAKKISLSVINFPKYGAIRLISGDRSSINPWSYQGFFTTAATPIIRSGGSDARPPSV